MGTAFLYGNGGGSGGTGAALTVTAPAGATVTVSKDGKSKTKVADLDGVAVFKGLCTGEWTVTITNGEQTSSKTVTITTEYAVLISFSTIPDFTFTGDFEIVNDSDEAITTSQDNWKIRFLTSGTLTFTELRGAVNGIDVFLVGGGGSGACRSSNSRNFGGGGGSGYTMTIRAVYVSTEVSYSLSIGSGGLSVKGDGVCGKNGGTTSAFDATVSGGYGGGLPSGTPNNGGKGGSNGGSGVGTNAGGIDGSPGQETTTREFGETGGKLYASGGTGGVSLPSSGTNNTGNGGDGSRGAESGTGGSGIVIIRNAREVS